MNLRNSVDLTLTGASLEVQDLEGLTPLDIAKRYQPSNTKLIAVLTSGICGSLYKPSLPFDSVQSAVL